MLQANFGYVIVEAVGEKSKVVTSGDSNYMDEGDFGNFIPGTTVYFKTYNSFKINHAGKDYLVLKEEDILAFEVEE